MFIDNIVARFKQWIPKSLKFTPATAEMDWQRIETLVSGPGAGDKRQDDMNSAVFSCLMAIATAYPEPPLVVYKERRDGTKVKQGDSPLQTLLDMPTPDGALTMEEILFWTAWAKHVDGNAYWMKVRSGNAETGNVVQIWPVSPTMIKPVSEGKDWISYYKYHDAPNHYVKVPVNNIIHFRLGIDDSDMRMGLAPLKALVRQISTDEEADKFVEALLKNYAVPGLVVTPDEGGTITEDQADIIKEKLQRKFGNDKRGNIAVMSQKSKVEQFGFSPDDLNLAVLHKVPEERISAVIGVPAIVAGLGAGLDRATYDNARSMGEWFTERKLIPQWRSDARKLNISLKPDFTSNPNISIEFDISDVRALQEDEDAKYTRLQKAVGKPWITRNEAREDTGLDPIDGWDDEDISPPEPPPPPDNTNVVNNLAPLSPEEAPKNKGSYSTKILKPRNIVYGDDEHKALWDKAINKLDPFEQKFADMFTKLIKAQERAVIARLDANKSYEVKTIKDVATDPFILSEWYRRYAKEAKRLLTKIIRQFGQDALNELGVSTLFNVYDPSVLRFLEGRAQRFAKEVNDVTWQELKDALGEGIKQGLSTDELADIVSETMGDRITSSAETIARTEVLSAANGGTLESWKQTDVVTGKQWLAALDDRTRDSHREAHGQTVGIDEDFEVGDGSGPAPGQIGLPEEDINCRCTMLAVME